MRKGWSVLAAIALVLSFSLVPIAQALPETTDGASAIGLASETSLMDDFWVWVGSLFGAADKTPATTDGPETEDRGEMGPRIDPNGSSFR